jgi:hypothetical protein
MSLPTINHTAGKVCLVANFGHGGGLTSGEKHGRQGFPILLMLRTRLQWAQERQRVLTENVANADTPATRRVNWCR